MEKKSRPNPKRKGRSLQRQMALDVIFEADLRGTDLSALLEERKVISTHMVPIGDYGVTIVATYTDNAADVDSMIEAASPNWPIGRMSVVDRCLLRVGATELMFLDVDLPVVVSEIKSLARDISTDRAVPFLMGVINRIGEIRAGETAGLNDNFEQLPVTGKEPEPK